MEVLIAMPKRPPFQTTNTSSENSDTALRSEVIANLMKYRLEIYAYLRAAVGNHHDAEDLLQEVSLAASRDFQQYKANSNFRAWVRQISRHRILDYRRKSGRRPALLQPAVLASLEEAAETVEIERPASARRDALRRCLEGLEGLSRRILALRYESNWEVARIAEAVQKSVLATYAIIKRSRQILRDCIDKRAAAESRG